MKVYDLLTMPAIKGTNIKAGYLWPSDDQYPIIGAPDAPDLIPAGACHRFRLKNEIIDRVGQRVFFRE